MTSEREKCGLSSLIPMSCRGRAEAFARRLHSRLRSLGSQDENGSADENSWLAGHENSIAISQPRHASDSDMYLDFGLLESPGSPEDEIEESEVHRLINNDYLKHSSNDECPCTNAKEINCGLTKSVKNTSNDSDSDGSFYDTENFTDHRTIRYVNGDVNSESSKSQESETGVDVSSQESNNSNQEDSYATTSDCTPQPSSTLSDDASTLSLRDIDDPSLATSTSSVDLQKDENDIADDIYSTCNGDITEEHNGEEKITPDIDSVCRCDESLDESIETYFNSISVEKDLTIEYPIGTKTETQNIEIQINDDDSEEERIPRVRRCSSLKTGKTPPNTPGRKKIVRFADVLGLDLADVRTFLDEIPKVPTSAYDDLKDVDLSESSSETNFVNVLNKSHGVKVDKMLMPLFQQPGGQPNFLDLVRDNQVCLENALVDDPFTFSIRGTVRVRNLDFHKSVYIRYTLDSWKTYADVQGTYLENSCDGFSDKFSFLIYAHTLSVGQRLEFACRFQCRGCQYWDSNSGANYCFQCLPATNNATVAPITGLDDWGASFY